MDSIFTLINDFYAFINDGFFAFLHELFVQINYYYVIWSIKAKIYFATVAWDVAQSLIANLRISELIDSHWGSVDSTVKSYANFFRIPEAITIVFQAYVTAFVIRLSS